MLKENVKKYFGFTGNFFTIKATILGSVKVRSPYKC